MTSSRQVRIPALDGLRAISVMLVIAWHVPARNSLPVLDQLWRVDSGNLGVRVFFVISGFLITTLLLDEQGRTGSISLSRFYLRRTLRIMPAFYAFLATLALARLLAPAWLNRVTTPEHALRWSDLLHAATYTADYLPVSWLVGHTWSLAVEEQFYLIWPFLLVFVGRRRAFRIALAMLFVSPVFRTFAATAIHWPDNPRYAFECVADALATGCLLAWFRETAWGLSWYRKLLSAPGFAFWPLAVFLFAGVDVRWPFFGATLGISLTNVAIAVGIDWCLRFPNGLMVRILNLRPIAFIGVLSYSLYLWQQPFFSPGVTLGLAYVLLSIAALALLSFLGIEGPFLRLRQGLERRIYSASRPAPEVLTEPAL